MKMWYFPQLCNFRFYRLYKIARTTQRGADYGDIVDEKRKAILNHVVGIHRHEEHIHYKSCTHGPTKTRRLDPGNV